jgi:hypothetical protein
MKSRLKPWIFFLILITAVGCGKSTEPKSPPDEMLTKNSGEPKLGPNLLLNADVLAAPEPNRYAVNLTWPNVPSEPQVPWTLLRFGPNQQREILHVLPPETKEYTDATVTGGTEYSFELTVPTSDGKYRTIAKTSRLIPEDLEIKGNLSLKEVKGVNRLFLRSGSTLSAKEDTLRIEVNEIRSESATITNFTDDLPGATGQGKHGGLILIKAHTGYGTLFVKPSGETGAAGIKGSDGNPGVHGERGLEGKCQRSPLHTIGPIRVMEVEHCSQAPTNGGNGGSGAPGGIGRTGGRGGNAGKVLVQISDSSNIKVVPLPSPGRGGLGGPGGAGGARGIRGTAGLPDPCGRCRKAVNGEDGAEGITGPAGVAGESGFVLPVCLKLGNATFGECETFPRDSSLIVR